MIKKFKDFKINENVDDPFDRFNDMFNNKPLSLKQKYDIIKQNISRDEADNLLFHYYNKCMDDFNGSVSEEAIYMLLDDIYGEDEEIGKFDINEDKHEADNLLFHYYNKCMDDFNGSVSEEAIYMLLDDIYGEEKKINESFDKETDYYAIRQYIEDQYGISGVSDSDIDVWIDILKKRGENVEEMTYIEIADSMYEDFEQRVEKRLGRK